MKSFLKKIFGKEGIEYLEKSTSQPLPTKLILESLNDNEVEYIKNNIGLAGELLKDLGIDNQNHAFHPHALGQAIQAWFDNDLENRFEIDVNMYSSALAAAWGNFLNEKLNMEWHVITNEFGTEIGLYHKNNDTTIFPFNSTLKAFNNRDFGLLAIVTEKAADIIG
ncbi:MAG: hypothetical protein IPL23_23225 [Saprospiraceae bacterium]|nr:hypothetical protein [Saprospiraceae bacterium]MBK8636019.1 hypothetical protein [Saprospiraceae bacterium]